MTTSMSVDIRICNDELTLNDLPFIGNGSCTHRRVSFYVAGQTTIGRLVLSVCLRSRRYIEESDKLLRGLPLSM